MQTNVPHSGGKVPQRTLKENVSIKIWGRKGCWCCSVAKLCLTLCSHGLQHAKLLRAPLSHRVCSNSCPLSQWCYLTISSSATSFSFCLTPSQDQGLFQWVSSLYEVVKVLELQHQSFQWIFRGDFLYDWRVWSPCCPSDSQESSPAPLLKSINSSALSLLFDPTLTFVHD